MVGQNVLSRRSLLQTTGAVGATALGLGATAASGADQTPQATDRAQIPVIDESASDADETISVLATVVDEDGEPLADEPVKLEDRGGTPDDRYGRTGASGQILFLESVGPPPCNTQTLRLPERGRSADLGCNDGGVHVQHTFEIAAGDGEDEVDYPVVDNASDHPDRTVTVDVAVRDEDGTPVADEPVKLEDRGGTPDDRYGRTGPNGRLRFLEDVGPPPCNTQTLKLPERGQSAYLGCNDGGASLEHDFEISSSSADADDDVPVVDNGSDDPDQTVTVDVTVLDERGEPLADEPVELEDRGGTPDDRLGRTGPEGRLRFLENVGPSPCNTQTLKLPERDQRASLGCNDGGVALEHTFEVPTTPQPAEQEQPQSADERGPRRAIEAAGRGLFRALGRR